MTCQHRHRESDTCESDREFRPIAVKPMNGVANQWQPDRGVANALALPRRDETARSEDNPRKNGPGFRPTDFSNEKRCEESSQYDPHEKAQRPGNRRWEHVIEEIRRIEQSTLGIRLKRSAGLKVGVPQGQCSGAHRAGGERTIRINEG